jgi:hypothetical protein
MTTLINQWLSTWLAEIAADLSVFGAIFALWEAEDCQEKSSPGVFLTRHAASPSRFPAVAERLLRTAGLLFSAASRPPTCEPFSCLGSGVP